VTLDFMFEDTPFDLRVSLSEEKPVMITEFIKGNDLSNLESDCFYKREKDRMSYKHKHWLFDVTSVKTVENTVENISFEVELEIQNLSETLKTTPTNYFIHSSLLKIKDLIGMCEKVEDESNLEFIQKKERKEKK
jgi:hypothetical protein